MSVLCEASDLVRQIAAPATGKAALLRAYRKLGTWTYSRVKDVYYADRRVRISADEIDELRAIARGRADTTNEPSIQDLCRRLDIVSRHLRELDPTFAHAWVEALCRETPLDRGEANRASEETG